MYYTDNIYRHLLRRAADRTCRVVPRTDNLATEVSLLQVRGRETIYRLTCEQCRRKPEWGPRTTAIGPRFLAPFTPWEPFTPCLPVGGFGGGLRQFWLRQDIMSNSDEDISARD